MSSRPGTASFAPSKQNRQHGESSSVSSSFPHAPASSLFFRSSSSSPPRVLLVVLLVVVVVVSGTSRAVAIVRARANGGETFDRTTTRSNDDSMDAARTRASGRVRASIVVRESRNACMNASASASSSSSAVGRQSVGRRVDSTVESRLDLDLDLDLVVCGWRSQCATRPRRRRRRRRSASASASAMEYTDAPVSMGVRARE